ncbi:flagellar assembly protein FliH [Paracoccaceae bacterium]|nr:flagellar assembly protein FliH [Paracoccaceae bacterium]
MHPLEEKDDSPLLDADITRLIKLSKEVGYKKQDNIPERNLVDFKPVSIKKIAVEASPQSQKVTTPNQMNEEEKAQIQEAEAKNNDITEEKNDLNEESDLKKEAQIQEAEAKNNDITEEKNDLNEESDLNKDKIEDKRDHEQTRKTTEENLIDKPIDPLEKEKALQQNLMPDTNHNDPIETAKKEGIEIGKSMAISEMEEDHRKNVDAINLLINNIKAKETIDKSDLMNSITDVVTNLASERAGLEIDKTPQVLKDKIVAFVDEIEYATKKVILNLHPKDAELIKQITKGAQLDQNIELKENSELFRGDYILQMGSIEMGNLISKQLHISEPYREEIVGATLTDNGFNPEEGTKNFKELEDTPEDKVKNKKTAEKNGK